MSPEPKPSRTPRRGKVRGTLLLRSGRGACRRNGQSRLKDAIIDEALDLVRAAGRDPAVVPELLCEEIIRGAHYVINELPVDLLRVLAAGLRSDDVLERLMLRAATLGFEDSPSIKRIQ